VHRRPGFPRAAPVAAIAGPVVLAVVIVITQIDRVDTAQDFVNAGPIEGVADDPLEERADDAVDDQSGTLSWFSLAGALITAIAFVMISLNAMRAGLLSRFMGYIGVIIGALYALFFLGGPQVVQVFWLGAVGLLFLGRWPGGRGPAWESGEAEPWPSAMEQRAAMERERAEAEGASSDGRGDLEAASADPDTPRTDHPRSKKRKRKRRR
jgi:hypothetical protein